MGIDQNRWQFTETRRNVRHGVLRVFLAVSSEVQSGVDDRDAADGNGLRCKYKE